MSVYIFGFATSIVLFLVANLVDYSKLSTFIRLLALIPPAFVAGIRNLDIGTDIGNYGEINFVKALDFKHFTDYLHFVKVSNGVESGYSLLNFLVSRFTDSISVFFFILNFLTMFFVLLALYQFKDKYFIIWGMLGYYLIFWGTSLNVMRQSLAATIVLFAISILVTHHFSLRTVSLSVLIILFAACFHKTALLALCLPIMYVLLRKQSKYIATTWVAIAIMLFFLLNPSSGLIIGSLKHLPFLSKYYNIFLETGMSYVAVGAGMSLKTVLIRTLPLIIVVVVLIRFKDFTDQNKLFFVMCLFAISFEFLNMQSGVIARLGMYFSIIQVIAVPLITRKVPIYHQTFLRNLVFVYLFIECVWIIHSGNGEIYPYHSQILQSFLS